MTLHTKTRTLLLLAALAVAVPLSASPLAVELGAAYTTVSGVRSYTAKRNLSMNNTKWTITPSVRLSYAAGERLSFGLGYRMFEDIESTGFSPSSDIFNESEVSLPIVLPVAGTEDIHEFALDAKWRVASFRGFDLIAGPSLDLFYSRSQIGIGSWPNGTTTVPAGSWRVFDSWDARLGGSAAMRVGLGRGWSLSASYRFAAPREHHLHSFGLSCGVAF